MAPYSLCRRVPHPEHRLKITGQIPKAEAKEMKQLCPDQEFYFICNKILYFRPCQFKSIKNMHACVRSFCR